MTPTALIVIVIVVGLIANAVLVYIALSRMNEGRARTGGVARRGPDRTAHPDRPARPGRPVVTAALHRGWHRPGASTVAEPTIRRSRPPVSADLPEREALPVRTAEDLGPDGDRDLAEAIAEFVRTSRAMRGSEVPSEAGAAGASDVAPPRETGTQQGRSTAIVVVDVRAGSGRVGLGQPRDIDVSVARALRRTARDADEVRRLGDASFAVLLAGTRGPGADAFVGRARKALAEVLAPYRGSTFAIAAADVADDPDEALQRALQSLDETSEERPRRGRPVSP